MPVKSRLTAVFHLAAAIVVAAGLAACAAPLHADIAPLIRLAPSSLGREIAVMQRLEVQAAGQVHTMDVALEVDVEGVRLAVMQLGHTVARLDWDGRQLEQSVARGWPDTVSAERVLSDLQLVWWPAAAVRSALPPGWSLQETAQERVLRHADRSVTVVRAVNAGHIELVQRTGGYTVQVYSQGASPVFAAP